MNKTIREILRQALRDGIIVTKVTNHQGHYKITVAANGKSKNVCVAGTPKNIDHTVRNALKDIRNFKDEKVL
jgi:hypothetical protein